MKEFYAKYLPKLEAKPFKMSGNLKIKYRSFIHHKRGTCIYLGKNLAIEARLFLCSSKYKKGDTIMIMGGEEKFKDVTLIKSTSTSYRDKKYWTVKENSNWYYEDFIGVQHFKIIAQISQFAVWVKEYSKGHDDECMFDESEISILGKSRGVHDDGSYNLCLIKCPTCENLH